MDANKLGRAIGKVMGAITMIGIYLGVSWIATCGIIWLITAILGIDFSWRIATAIWIAFTGIKLFFRDFKEDSNDD